MKRAQAEMLAKELTELLVGEQIILVESYQWEGLIPRHVTSGLVVTNVFTNHYDVDNVSVLTIKTGAVDYCELNNPFIDNKTIAFAVRNKDGNRIYRSFTLAREYKNLQEMNRWTQLKYALL